jgi:hypothetical protein
MADDLPRQNILSEDFITPPQHTRDPDRSGLSDASTITFEDSQLARLSQIIRREIANALPAQLNADSIQRYINHQVLAAVAACPTDHP